MRKRKTEVSALPAVDADENGGVALAEGEERVELSALRENPDNPQTVTEEEFGKLRDSMRRIHGFLRTRPILVEEDGTIKCGNKRFRALVKNGVKLDWRDMDDLDSVFSAMVDFLIATNADTVAMAQAGDFVGGISSTAATHPVLRKAMNTFFCRTDRPVRFQGSINEDVSMYALAGLRGRLVLTLTSVMIVQMVTQTNAGGITGTYLDGGTYLKSFYSVMAAPSCVRISMLHGGTKDTAQHWRIHHHVKWENCAAKIISARWRKGRGGR